MQFANLTHVVYKLHGCKCCKLHCASSGSGCEPYFPVVQNGNNSNDKETKLEVIPEDENKKIVKEPESENASNKAAEQSIAKKGDVDEGGEKTVSKEVKTAKDEVVDKDLLQVIFSDAWEHLVLYD
jgi:hypothetical protein